MNSNYHGVIEVTGDAHSLYEDPKVGDTTVVNLCLHSSDMDYDGLSIFVEEGNELAVSKALMSIVQKLNDIFANRQE